MEYKRLDEFLKESTIKVEIDNTQEEKNELYNQYQIAREEVQRLDTIRHNLEQHLGRKIEHKQEQER